jgi:predicted transposase YbfD/YdcC
MHKDWIRLCPRFFSDGKRKVVAQMNPVDYSLPKARLIIDTWPLMAKRFDRPAKLIIAFINSVVMRVATGRVLWHCNVQEKHNEISELRPLLTTETLKGRILSLDALHTQRQFCRQVQQLEGDDVLIAKDNQPTLKEDITDFFEDPTPDRRRWQEAETWDKAHGRLEYRHIVCSPDLNDWFANDWQGIGHVFRLERWTLIVKTGEIRHEIVYGLSSLSLQDAPACKMLALVREHWAIGAIRFVEMSEQLKDDEQGGEKLLDN